MNELRIEKRRCGDVTILDLNGNITITSGGDVLSDAIKKLLEQGSFNILLNLKRVVYVDSAGLGNMICGYNRVTKQGGQIKLVNLTNRVRDLMVITKLLTVFDVYDDEATALKSCH